jgi:hypothetical protein
MDLSLDDQALSVYQKVALATVHLLTTIIASWPPCIFDSSLMVIEHGYRGWQTDAPLVWEGREKAWVASSSLRRARTVAWAREARILQGRASKEVVIGF